MLAAPENLILVDWVFSCWNKSEIFQVVDRNLGTNYVPEEVELVLKLGLLCSNAVPLGRPSMQRVVQYLEGHAELPELSSFGISVTGLTFAQNVGFDDFVMSYPSSRTESLLSSGR